ncbi:MAG: (2Fe-2S)-binding protein [Candidatus Aminicenantes bacterium]
MAKKEKEKKQGKVFTRRSFLKGFGGGALGTAVAPRLLGQEKEALESKQGEIPLYSRKRISMTVNGKKHNLMVEPRETLLDVLRERLNLTGAKRICNRGECGGCTVIMDGDAVYACMFLAIRADGKNITTVEGLADHEKLHPVQQAFVEKDGYQCGFCTPGFIMSAKAYLQKNKNPNLDEIKQALSGNLCRCGNYFKIYEAVQAASQKMRGG